MSKVQEIFGQLQHINSELDRYAYIDGDEADFQVRRLEREKQRLESLLTTTPPAAQLAPVQEPIGYFTVNDYDMWEQIDGTSGKPLYERPAAQRPVAEPHKWVGLTDEERKEIWKGCDPTHAGYVTALVEAKLKEKNT